MPISYRVDAAAKRMYSFAHGLVTFDELLEHIDAESGKPAASYPEIFDCTGATTNITARDIRALAERRRLIAERQPAAAVAIVAPTDIFFGLFRVFDVLTDEIRPLQVFRTVAEAEKWLDSTAT
jgi:hypothetical protein